MNPQVLPIVSIPWEIHEEAKALGMDAEELWRQRHELAEWLEAVTATSEQIEACFVSVHRELDRRFPHEESTPAEDLEAVRGLMR